MHIEPNTTASSSLVRPAEQRTVERRMVHFSGHVQGVGFRCTVQNIALNYDVCGYVKNLVDGHVLVVVEGTVDQLDEFVASIQQRMDHFIRNVHVDCHESTGEFDGFGIRQ